MPVVVRLRSAVCLLGRFPALAGVDLDVEAGEVVLLSGANGSGKTTLLRLLAGLHQLHTGTGVVLGHDLSIDRRGARRAIGLLGHDTGCYDDLTVRENLRFAVRAAGGDASASDNSLERVGLTAQADVGEARRGELGETPQVAGTLSGMAKVELPGASLLRLRAPHAGPKGRLDDWTPQPAQAVLLDAAMAAEPGQRAEAVRALLDDLGEL